MRNENPPTLALFYCQNVPGSSERDRQALEKKYGKCLRLFPIPCSGRLEPVHLLRALEEFADMAYVITCPEGACRYFEGNRRAKKRVERTKTIIAGIGLEPERVGIIISSRDTPKPLEDLVEAIFKGTSQLGRSPVLQQAVNKC
jgi:F420-non-reducing hydrogenase iron-sulfur subunit